MYPLIRPLLFQLDPERAHDLTIASMRALGRVLGPGEVPEVSPVEKMGLRFNNPIGLAAGLDKDATAFPRTIRIWLHRSGYFRDAQGPTRQSQTPYVPDCRPPMQ